MNINFDINLTNSQKEAYDLAHIAELKYIVMAWSRQSGKTTLMELLCIEWLLTRRSVRIGYVCRSYLLAKKIYKEIVSLLPSGCYESANGSDLTISAGNSNLQFYSAESGSALRGNTFDYLILDEFAFFKFEQPDGTHLWFDILSPTIKVRGRKCIFVSTPLGKNNLFHTFYSRGVSENDWKTWKSIKRTIYDDGLITDEQINEIQTSIPDLSFRQEYLCEFLDDAVTFFKGFDKCFNGDMVFRTNHEIYIGVDFSASGEDRTVITKLNEKGQVWQEQVDGTLDERYRQLANIISNTPTLKHALFEKNGVGDPMGNEVMKLLPFNVKNKVGWFTTTNASKNEIISALAVSIADGNITYSDHQLYDELQAFRCSYSKTGKTVYGGVGKHDDRVMSLAIALRAKKTTPQEVTIGFAKMKNTTID